MGSVRDLSKSSFFRKRNIICAGVTLREQTRPRATIERKLCTELKYREREYVASFREELVAWVCRIEPLASFRL